MADYFVHPTAIVETKTIGAGTRIWAHVHIMADVLIGPDCNICDNAFIESGARIGRGVTIKTGVSICEGVTLEDGCFIGPDVIFTNDLQPRSPRIPFIQPRYRDKQWLSTTTVGVGASLGANAVISCGLTIGNWAFIGAGTVVVRNVPPFAFMVGKPARALGYVCACNTKLDLADGAARCGACGRRYRLEKGALRPVKPIKLWE